MLKNEGNGVFLHPHACFSNSRVSKQKACSMRYFFLSFLSLVLVFSSCKHDPVGVDNQPAVCFRQDILPIFQANCAKSGCHDGSGERGLDLRSAEDVRANVVPYDPSGSRIYDAITSSWGGIMPPGSPLPKEARTAVYLWILQGADTTCASR
jgi:hypothetical protein